MQSPKSPVVPAAVATATIAAALVLAGAAWLGHATSRRPALTPLKRRQDDPPRAQPNRLRTAARRCRTGEGAGPSALHRRAAAARADRRCGHDRASQRSRDARLEQPRDRAKPTRFRSSRRGRRRRRNAGRRATTPRLATTKSRCRIRCSRKPTASSSSCPSRRFCARCTASASFRKCSPISGSTISTSTRARARPLHADRIRARRHPAARARQVPRSARGRREESGDALLSRQLDERRSERAAHAADGGAALWPRTLRRRHDVSAGRPAERAGEERAQGAQRELRPRADGAAHARRRRRLHAEGRHRGRARLHRLDDSESAPGRRLQVRAAHPR